MKVVFIKPLPTHMFPAINSEFNKEHTLFSVFEPVNVVKLRDGVYSFNIGKHYISFEEMKECFKVIEG